MSTPWSAASIRVRLTGWYALVLSLMLVVYATATFMAVRHEFLEQLDDQLAGVTARRQRGQQSPDPAAVRCPER